MRSIKSGDNGYVPHRERWPEVIGVSGSGRRATASGGEKKGRIITKLQIRDFKILDWRAQQLTCIFEGIMQINRDMLMQMGIIYKVRRETQN